jgi:hypothetical protein
MAMAFISLVMGALLGIALWFGIHSHWMRWSWGRVMLFVLPIALVVWLGVMSSDGWGWLSAAGLPLGYLYRAIATKGEKSVLSDFTNEQQNDTSTDEPSDP